METNEHWWNKNMVAAPVDDEPAWNCAAGYTFYMFDIEASVRFYPTALTSEQIVAITEQMAQEDVT
jgi:hypothetical protein